MTARQPFPNTADDHQIGAISMNMRTRIAGAGVALGLAAPLLSGSAAGQTVAAPAGRAVIPLSVSFSTRSAGWMLALPTPRAAVNSNR